MNLSQCKLIHTFNDNKLINFYLINFHKFKLINTFNDYCLINFNQFKLIHSFNDN